MSTLGPSPLAAGDRSLSVAEARAAIAAALQPVLDTQADSLLLPLSQALGRVLAADVVSPLDVPAHDNSAMDGYAFAGSALQPGQPTQLLLRGTVFAGSPFAGNVGPGECLRIMTGAVMPEGLDTVVPQELCQTHIDTNCDTNGDTNGATNGATVSIAADTLRLGDNRRHRGEDLKRGHAALRQGRVLQPADLGLLASLGIHQARVLRRLRVALFSSGDELRGEGQALPPGCVYDSNRASLTAALQRLGMEVIDLGIVRDDPAALRATLQAATEQADVVLTSGGVSVGDADHTRALLAQMGSVAFWKVAMRPGRPFAFGPLQREGQARPSWLFALPGNPVAALVTFYVFAREALLYLSGATPRPLPVLQARCTSAIRKRPGRMEFQRAIVEPAPAGAWQVRLTGSQGAGVLRSMSEANALLVLNHDQGSVAEGELVDVWLFDGLA